jgi:predicted amino acid dehydrogenase
MARVISTLLDAMHTLLGFLWRFFAALLDWRLILRRLRKVKSLDVVCVTNMRDDTDRKLFLGRYEPSMGHYNGPRFYLHGVSGITRAICSTSEDIQHANTSLRAKEQCISAIEYCQEKGAKIVLLAASTKRLFGLHGEEIKEMFPGLLFTLGDNGTFFLLLSEALRAFNKAGLSPGNSRICVIGPYGLLGELMVKHLIAKGFSVVGLGSSQSRLEKMRKMYNIEISTSYEDLGLVDAVVACTHSSVVRLTQERINLIRRVDRKLLVIDVSEPSNLTKEEYKKCKGSVIRQDAGNGYSPGLKYVLGAITYKMFRLTRGVTFGCFMEALVWQLAIKDNPSDVSFKSLDLFSINDENMEIISKLFAKYDVRIPSPRNFGRRVNSFDLNLEDSGKTQKDNSFIDEDETKML